MARLRGMENHDCAECSLKKKIICDIDEVDVSAYEKIMTGINIADIAINPNLIEDDSSEEKIKTFINTVMGRKEKFKQLEIEWWRGMLKKYKISNLTKIDVFTRKFYACVDDKGIEKMDFEQK
jgi:predicted ATPase